MTDPSFKTYEMSINGVSFTFSFLCKAAHHNTQGKIRLSGFANVSGCGCLLLWIISVGGKCRYSYLSSGLFIDNYLYNKVKYCPPVVSDPGKLLLWNRFFKDNSSLFLTKQRKELCYYCVTKYFTKGHTPTRNEFIFHSSLTCHSVFQKLDFYSWWWIAWHRNPQFPQPPLTSAS